MSVQALIAMLARGLPGLGPGIGGGADAGLNPTAADAVTDEGMEAVLQQLMSQYSGPSGAPPASAAAVSSLYTFTLEPGASLPPEVELSITGVAGDVVAIPAGFGPPVPSAGITALVVAVGLTGALPSGVTRRDWVCVSVCVPAQARYVDLALSF